MSPSIRNLMPSRGRPRDVRERTQRTKRAVTTSIVVLFLGSAAVYLAFHLPVLRERTVSGHVRCSSGAEVAGVWVVVVVGDRTMSGYADVRPRPLNTPYNFFTRTVRAEVYSLHVGCGGTAGHWATQIYSDDLRASSVDMICFDRRTDPRYGTCASEPA